MKQKMLQMLFVVLMSAGTQVNKAGTVAYWRFEGDGTNAPTANQLVTTFASHTAIQNDGLLAVDSSGNGNTIYGWDSSWNDFWVEYENNVPAPTVTQTGDTNSWCVWTVPVGNLYPAIATWSAKSNPTGTDIETMTPKAWTVEASINSSSFAGTFHTFVGRDGNHVANSDTSRGPLYFSVNNDNLANLVITVVNKAGSYYFISDPASLALNHWYNVAAVSDGTNLFLYKDSTDGNGYQLVGSLVETGTNTALAVPTGSYATMSDGSTWAWSVGRGRYGTSANPGDDHVDRFYGYIDEVRISDTALQPSQFLFAAPKRPVVTSLMLNGTNAVFAGTNGLNNGTLYVLTTTNLTLPRSNWTRVSTNVFDGSGNFNFTNSVTASHRQSFYILQLP